MNFGAVEGTGLDWIELRAIENEMEVAVLKD